MFSGIKSAATLLALLFVVCLTSAVSVSASDISISPSQVRLDLKTDPPHSTITYTNNTSQVIQLTFSASDFRELEDGYKMSFIQAQDAGNYQYHLSTWISFDRNSITLPPGQSDEVTVLVNADRLTPGAHYGNILATVQSEDKSAPIQLREIIGSLLFVRANTGQEITSGSISSFRAQESYFGFPDQFYLRFNNTGNVEVVPYGIVRVTDFRGSQVGQAILNEGSLIVLPESIRRFTLSFVSGVRFLLPGFYTARLDMYFSDRDHSLTSEVRFFSLGNTPLVPAVFLILVTVVFVLRSRRRQPVTKTSRKSKSS